MDAQQPQDALGDPLAHGRQVERLADEPGDAGQLLGLLPAADDLRVAARVLERERGLVGEGLEQRHVVVAEDAPGGRRDGQDAGDALLHAQRHGQQCAGVGIAQRAAATPHRSDRRQGEQIGICSGRPESTTSG